jgi:hypothetical protein
VSVRTTIDSAPRGHTDSRPVSLEPVWLEGCLDFKAYKLKYKWMHEKYNLNQVLFKSIFFKLRILYFVSCYASQ